VIESWVTVFSRPGCHLCELMADELEPLCRAVGLTLRVLDVDTNPAWRDRYGLRIPVACVGGEELTGWPMNREHAMQALRAHVFDRASSGANSGEASQ